MVHKVCFVPSCCNNNKNAPKKIFVSVPPHDCEQRARWFKAINIEVLGNHNTYCCEDHFNLEDDAENWMHFKTIGSRLMLRKDVVPHLNLHAHNHQLESQLSDSCRKRKLETLEQLKTCKPIEPLFVDVSTIIIFDNESADITSDPTCHDQLNTEVKEEFDELIPSSIGSGTFIQLPSVSNPGSSVLQCILIGSNEPMETSEITSQDLELVMKCEPETYQVTEGFQTCLPTPDTNMEYVPKLPEQAPNLSSSLLVSTPSTLNLHEETIITHTNVMCTVQTQTPAKLLSTLPKIVNQAELIRFLTKENDKLKKLLNQKNTPEVTLDSFSKHCDVFLTPPVAEFIKTQAKLCNVPHHSRRYNDEYKEFSKKIYSLGPRCYKYLQTLFCLPSMKALQRERTKALHDQAKEKLPQEPVESLHHMEKQIKRLPPHNNEQLQETGSLNNKQGESEKILVDELKIKNEPDIVDEEIHPIEIKYLLDIKDEPLD